MANQQALIYKLQLALKQKGYIISINTTQFYSGDRGRYIKGYILKRNYKIVYSSYSTIRIIRYLVNLLNIVKTLNKQEIQSRRIDTIIEQRMEEIYKCQKQFEFFENYLATNNITQSAIDAGYSEKTAGQQGCRMLKSIKGQNYIADRMAELDEEKVATANEVLEYLTSVMRGEVQDQFDLEPSLSDRTKAASELARRLVDTKAAVIPVKIVDDIPRTKEA